MTEEELVKGCIKEKKSSQEMLYNKFAGKLMVVALRYMDNRMDAEDVLQEGFIKIFDNISKFQFRGSFEGWMKRIVANEAISKLRRKDILKGSNDTNLIKVEWNDAVLSQLEGEEIMEVIQGLSPGYRIVFNMYVIEGYSHREIADKLGIEEVSSRSQLAKAKKVLQERINKLTSYKLS